MRDLQGKVAVVTGAASGIGKAMAERFAREGMKVVLADVDEPALAMAQQALAASGTASIAVRTDVSKRADVDALHARALDAFGAVHVLCNNAGVGVGGPMWERSEQDWAWILGVNLWGVIHGVSAFVPAMIAQGEGHVVNTASIAGLIGTPMLGPYCVTKHAVVALSECLHHDLALAAEGKVKVSVLCPGFVRTNIADSERNRPASLTRGVVHADQQAMMDQMMRAAVAGGIAPENVADEVLRAVREERFYVFTHPELKGAFATRAKIILDEGTPVPSMP
jgi:NAD(P)-dependent dehydrogenase (short-subunit alcohol dehydrogenase family)